MQQYMRGGRGTIKALPHSKHIRLARKSFANVGYIRLLATQFIKVYVDKLCLSVYLIYYLIIFILLLLFQFNILING